MIDILAGFVAVSLFPYIVMTVGEAARKRFRGAPFTPPPQTALSDLRSLKFETREQCISSVNSIREIIGRVPQSSPFFISTMVLVDLICANLVRDGKAVIADQCRTMPGTANTPWTNSHAFIDKLSLLSLKYLNHFTVTSSPIISDSPTPYPKRQQHHAAGGADNKRQKGKGKGKGQSG